MSMSDGSIDCESISRTTSVVARSRPSSSPLTDADATAERPLKRGTPLTQRATASECAARTRSRSSSGSARGRISASSAGRDRSCRSRGR
jgi:hypothetical protein